MAPKPPLFNRLALIGVGLIGSSIAHAARAQGAVREIVATARGADLVIACVPVGACGEVAKEIAPHLKAGAIVSDVGSVKAAIVRDMAPNLPVGVHFVPAHPVAGTEHSGPDAGFAELFVGRWCILTPPNGVATAAVD